MSVTVEETHQTVVLVEDTSAGIVVVTEDDGDEVTIEPEVQTVIAEDLAVSIIEVQEGMPGPPGPAGSSGERLELVRPAAGALSGHRAVVEANGAFVYADNATADHVWRQLAVTTGATAAGDNATAVTLGPLEEPTWSWTPGQPVWLGATGALTQALPAAPTALFLLEVGVALSPTSMFVDPRSPIRLET